jgi:hypothetical protein
MFLYYTEGCLEGGMERLRYFPPPRDDAEGHARRNHAGSTPMQSSAEASLKAFLNCLLGIRIRLQNQLLGICPRPPGAVLRPWRSAQ